VEDTECIVAIIAFLSHMETTLRPLVDRCLVRSQQFTTQCVGKWHRDGIANLLVASTDAPAELEGVREALRSCALSDRNDAVLIRVENLAHLSHRIGICGGSGEVTAPLKAREKASPLVVSGRCVREAPRDDLPFPFLPFPYYFLR